MVYRPTWQQEPGSKEPGPGPACVYSRREVMYLNRSGRNASGSSHRWGDLQSSSPAPGHTSLFMGTSSHLNIIAWQANQFDETALRPDKAALKPGGRPTLWRAQT